MFSRVIRIEESKGPAPVREANGYQIFPGPSEENPLRAHSARAPRLLQAVLTLENAFYEYYLRVSTRGLYGFAPGDWSRMERLYYATIPYGMIFRILDSLSLERSDVVVDLGCGKGRVLCCASRYDVGQVIGVEVREKLCETAERNLRRMWRKRAPCTIIHGKAEEFDYKRGTVFYMFHPFGPSTLKSVLLRLNCGVRESPRRVRIVYVNPVHDAVLEETGWLERHDHWSTGRGSSRHIVYPVSFWRLRPAAGASSK